MHHEHRNRHVGSPTLVRAARTSDGAGMWRLASSIGLDVNAPYAYLLWGRHHHRTTIVAERGGALVGFVLGYVVPTTARDLFIWQVGVDDDVRAQGLAGLMLDTLCASIEPLCIEATVSPSNVASAALFRSLARRHSADLTISPCFIADQFPVEHDAEDLYRITLRTGTERWSRPPSRGESLLGAV